MLCGNGYKQFNCKGWSWYKVDQNYDILDTRIFGGHHEEFATDPIAPRITGATTENT